MQVHRVEVAKTVIIYPGGKRYAAYSCRVHVHGGMPSWTIQRRYREWDELYSDLLAADCRGLPALPAKKVLGNMDPVFLERRRADLQRWVDAVVGDDALCGFGVLCRWLQPRAGDSPRDINTVTTGLRATTSLGGELPPAMQGQLFVVRGDVGAGSWNWFELRENQLTWFEARDGAELHRADLLAAVVATSGALQAQHAKASAVACSFFSITSERHVHVVGAPDSGEMRAWMSKILALQGDRKGAAAILEGRVSLRSHELPPSPDSRSTRPLSGAGAQQPLPSDNLECVDPLGVDPLGGCEPRASAPPLCAPDMQMMDGDAVGSSGGAGGGGGGSICISVQRFFQEAGGLLSQLRVVCAHEVRLLGGLSVSGSGGARGEPEPEPEPLPHQDALCICEYQCEFGFVHVQVPIVAAAVRGSPVLAVMPIAGATECRPTRGAELRLTLHAMQSGRLPDRQLDGVTVQFRTKVELDNLIREVERARRIVGPQQANTHGWLTRILRGSQIERNGSPSPMARSAARSLLSQSSNFYARTDEAYLLDPKRRRRLKATATADSNGAYGVVVVAPSDHISGSSAFHTRTEMRDRKEVTMYELSLARKQLHWTVTRRYSDFVMLQDALRVSCPAIIQHLASTFPSRTVRSSTHPEVILERSKGLFAWLTALLRDSQAVRTKDLISFLGMKNSAATGEKSGPTGTNFWQPNAGVGSQDGLQYKSVDYLGRSIAQLITEHKSVSSPDKVVEQLLECRAFREALLDASFDVRYKDSSAAPMIMKLVPDAVEIESVDATERLVYSDIESVRAEPPTAFVIACPHNEKHFELQRPGTDVQEFVDEVNDRIQFTRHSLAKQAQFLGLAKTGSSEFQRQTYEVTKRRLEEMTGKTEEQRIATTVDRILNGEKPRDAKEIANPLCKFLNVTFLGLLSEPGTVTRHVREVMDDLQAKILEERRQELEESRIGGLFAEDDGSGVELLAEIVNQQLERVTVYPVREQLFECLRRSIPAERLERVESRRVALRSKPQSYFGIPDAAASPTKWLIAVAEMNKIEAKCLPSEKVQVLLRCTTKIYELYDSERGANTQEDGDLSPVVDSTNPIASTASRQEFLAADEFLSVFMYVTVQSKLSTPLAIAHKFMAELCDPEVLTGQVGYCLTVLESTIQCIHNAELDSESIFACGNEPIESMRDSLTAASMRESLTAAVGPRSSACAEVTDSRDEKGKGAVWL